MKPLQLMDCQDTAELIDKLADIWGDDGGDDSMIVVLMAGSTLIGTLISPAETQRRLRR